MYRTIALCTLLGVFAQARADDPAPAGAPPLPARKAVKPVVLDKPVEQVLAERIAKQIIAASPIAEPGDMKARDAAGVRLVACEDFIQAAEGRILYGTFNPDQGYDPAAYRLEPIARDDFNRLTEFKPMVFAKLYLSTFMFPGPYTIRREGNYTVLEIEARFRGGLDAGEYPYPFWHSPNKWTSYLNTQAILFIFEHGQLSSVMRKSPPPIAVPLVKRPWDAKWTWNSENGEPQPRVALFTYLFQKDNPYLPQLDKTYRELERDFRAQDCISCHAPDNQSHMNELLLLTYPNQALIMRRNLVMVLEENRMPPGDFSADEATGIRDEAVRQRLITLAKEFARNADAAFEYERSHGAKGE